MPRRKQYQVINASKNPVVSVTVDGRNIPIDKHGGTYIHDSGLAREINQRYGQAAVHEPDGDAVRVIEVDDRDPQRERGHQYTFTVPDLSRFKKSKG